MKSTIRTLHVVGHYSIQALRFFFFKERRRFYLWQFYGLLNCVYSSWIVDRDGKFSTLSPDSGPELIYQWSISLNIQHAFTENDILQKCIGYFTGILQHKKIEKGKKGDNIVSTNWSNASNGIFSSSSSCILYTVLRFARDLYFVPSWASTTFRLIFR